MNLARLRNPRVASDEASKRTLRNRTVVMTRIRAKVCGGDVDGDPSRSQLSHEVSRTSKEDRRQLLVDAGFSISPSHSLEPGTGLVLKADLDLPWARLRILRRFVLSVTKVH